MTALPQPCAEPGCPGVIVLGWYQPFPSVAAQFGRVCSVNPDHELPMACTFAVRAVAVRADAVLAGAGR